MMSSPKERWVKDAKIGEGAYAVVYKGHESTSGRQVAIKKFKAGQSKDGLDLSAIREVKCLRELHHPNVIELLDVYTTLKQNLNIVLEYLDGGDLELVIKDRSLVFLPADIKSWMAMTCRGLEFCHRNSILHRDLKPSNLLISANGELKLADFGLARPFADPYYDTLSCRVITRWYRPPELLFGCMYYSSAVDMWSVGCIFAELMLRVPFLAGDTDIDQLKTIFRALGTPTEADWPGYTKLPDYCPVGQFPRPRLRDLFTAATTDALNLLVHFLVYDPNKRISAKDALGHPYFFALPNPSHPSKLPKVTKRAECVYPLEELDGNAVAQSAAKNGEADLKRKNRDELELPAPAKRFRRTAT
ncbi:Pkinase-domain-containing protein [Auricularia subglabra TFB-10046 SS5]|nr:Pkinase-domain-containing protein [Auricularia subglabra TFB-10046 SS5]